MQITWIYNYQACSTALYGDNRLVQNPDLVAVDPDDWGCSFWFWNANVHNAPGVQQFHFGATTNAINGGLECNGGPNQNIAMKRYALYVNVLKAFGITATPIESGCYN